MRRGFLGMFFRLYSGTETFMRAYPPPADRVPAVSDLFDLPPGK